MALQCQRLRLSMAADHVQDVLLDGCAEVRQRQHLERLLYLDPDVLHLHSKVAKGLQCLRHSSEECV